MQARERNPQVATVSLSAACTATDTQKKLDELTDMLDFIGYTGRSTDTQGVQEEAIEIAMHYCLEAESSAAEFFSEEQIETVVLSSIKTLRAVARTAIEIAAAELLLKVYPKIKD